MAIDWDLVDEFYAAPCQENFDRLVAASVTAVASPALDGSDPKELAWADADRNFDREILADMAAEFGFTIPMSEIDLDFEGITAGVNPLADAVIQL